MSHFRSYYGRFAQRTSVSAHLKEIDLAGDCHKEFKRVHKHFLKRFAYLCR